MTAVVKVFMAGQGRNGQIRASDKRMNGGTTVFHLNSYWSVLVISMQIIGTRKDGCKQKSIALKLPFNHLESLTIERDHHHYSDSWDSTQIAGILLK